MTFWKIGAVITLIVLFIGLFVWGVHEINRPVNQPVGTVSAIEYVVLAL